MSLRSCSGAGSDGSHPSDSERLRVIAIEANALARMAAGEPAESE